MRAFVILIIFFCVTLLNAQEKNQKIQLSKYSENISITTGRQEFLLNENWQYLEKNPDLQDLTNTDEWININLPHTWNNHDATDNDPGYRRSSSWYRKEIFIPENTNNKRWQIYFEGVNISCDVFVNGKRAGGHIGGYIGFNIDISSFIKAGKLNKILVKVDNSINRDIIPSQKSDFFIFGGITRDVWLKSLPAVYVEKGLIQTPAVNEEKAETTLSISIKNTSNKTINGMVKIDLVDPYGNLVSTKTIKNKLSSGNNKLEIHMDSVADPQLWSPDSPSLYTANVALIGDYNDTISEKYGYRWFEFKDNGPFYLNGKRLLLRGTHRHEEYAGYGNAMPNELHRKDMQQIKEMGANFVRLAHYPQDPEIYKACDKLGIIVWDELPWCRGGMGGNVWKENTKRLLREQINQNFNHPSIIFWSIGNEMYWIPDFPGGGNPDSLKAMASELNNIAHDLDPSRFTAMRKYYDGAEITDVFSPSIWAGWYSGVYKTYQKALEQAKPKYKRFIHTEYGGSSHFGRHNINPISGEGLVNENEWDEKPNMINVARISEEGDWSENYIVDLFDWHLMVSENLDWLAGNAQWAFKDFGTPLRPENAIPYMNQKGLVDRAGNPKDAYYVFKSYWTTDPKFCYIESKTWTDQYGKENQERNISVFSNCDKVKLIINGIDLGVRERNISVFPASGLNWDVKFIEGLNKLIAYGVSKNGIIAPDTLVINYHTQKHKNADHIKLTSTQLDNGHILVNACVVDEDSRLVPDYNKRVYFDLNGHGKLLKYMGTPTGSSIIEFASGKAGIEYIPDGNKPAVIEARTQDFKGDYIHINKSSYDESYK